jgi:vacuolar-type H+-ATPase subunit H
MTKGSEDIKGNQHGSGTQGHSSNSGSHSDAEFLSQVRLLRDAEKSSAQRVEEAKKQSAQIEASAREAAVEITGKAQQKAVEAKNEILARQRQATESEIGALLGTARKQAAAIRAKRLDDSDISGLLQKI